MTAVSTGVVYIHSTSRAVCPHIEWAISRVLGKGISLNWGVQPLLHKSFRSEYLWRGPAGSGALIASALFGWQNIRFEVTEDATDGKDGGRWCYTPKLGMFHSATDSVGNMVISENRIRSVLEFAGMDPDLLRTGLERSLGAQWDKELDVFREVSDETPVRWLHQVG